MNFNSEASTATSGITVNQDTALNYSAVYCAVTLLSNALKILPASAYRNTEDGGKTKVAEHPAHILLHRHPNPEMRPSVFKGYVQTSALLWDVGYAWIERSNTNQPKALWPIHPSRVVPGRDDSDALVFDVYNNDGSGVRVSEADMFRVFGTSTDGIGGTSIVRLARETIGLGMATESFGASFFGRGARPSGLLSHPGKGVDAKAWADKFTQQFGGQQNWNKTGVLSEGVTYTQIGLPNEVSQFLETREFGIEEIARWFNVPPHKLKQLLRATFSNIEHQSLEYVTDSVMPWLIAWEEEAGTKLFSESEQTDHFVKFNVTALLRGDSKARSEFYAKMQEHGDLTINETRLLEDMNPIGPDGDVHLVPANMMTLQNAIRQTGTKAAQATNDASQTSIRVAYAQLLRDAFSRCIQREADGIRRVLRKNKGAEAFVDWLTQFYAESHAKYATQAIGAIAASVAYIVGRDTSASGEQIVATYLQTSEASLKDIINADAEWMVAIDLRLREWVSEGAERWAGRAVAMLFDAQGMEVADVAA